MPIILALDPNAQVEAETGGVGATVDPAIVTISVTDAGDLVVECELRDLKDTLTVSRDRVDYEALASAAFLVRDVQERQHLGEQAA